MSAWTNPWRVINADKQHVYSVKNIVSGKVKMNLVRLRYLAPDTLKLSLNEGIVSTCFDTRAV